MMNLRDQLANPRTAHAIFDTIWQLEAELLIQRVGKVYERSSIVGGCHRFAKYD